ncbi:autotransporter outer membrane beta-barrel domain-containing protein [Pseudomonas maioricensis]|uniref:autotransporter outer membrane beta-barrel domain-containing protein n=1 Tax=Pseudomonas maioricensis TaxID=1766623 RepID=UPI0030EB1736
MSFIGKSNVLWCVSLGVYSFSCSAVANVETLQQVIDNGYSFINSTVLPDSYLIKNGSLLEADNATLKSLVSRNSRVSLKNDTHVHGELRLEHGSTFEVSESSINHIVGSIAMYVGEGSKGVIANSKVVGVGLALSVNKGGELAIVNTTIKASEALDLHTGWGLGVFGSKVEVSEGSRIEGLANGIHVSLPTAGEVDYVTSYLSISDSHVQSYDESAIKVAGLYGLGVVANIDIYDDSTIVAGNGNLLEVIDYSTANLKVENSTLNGNLVADTSSTLNVTLQRNAQLTGNIINSDKLAISSGASWTLADSNQVNALAMEGGRVSFGEGAYKTLTLGELSGRGTFDMRVNLDERQGDLLRVEGLATGNHGLRVKNTGVEVVDPDMQRLLLVDTDGGDAQFSLVGGRADLGVYSYELEQQGDDWFIVGSGRGISPSTQSVLALFNAAPNIWNSELSTLRSRIGEVRGHEQGGGWMRAYGSRFNASTGDGVDYRNNQSGMTLGADAPLPVSVGQLSLGLMAGYSKNDLAIGQGTSGKIGSYYVGGYGTWLLDDGYYLDAVLKLNRFRNESKVAMSDGDRAKGNYQSTGLGGSLEFGRNIRFADGYFLEPYAQFSSVWIKGDSYALDNGMQARNDQTQSVLAKVGASAGRSIILKDGAVVRPYVRLAAAQEFARDNEVKVNSTRFDNDLSGSRAEVGAGVSVSLSERLQLHADFDYMKGRHVEQPWGANVGLKLAF